MTVTIMQGDARDVLKSLPDESVHMVCTSPPYWNLRSYLPDSHDDKHLELGLEPTIDEYIANMVDVFREVRRVLRKDGTCWLNIGDSYAGSWGNQSRKEERGTQRPINGEMLQVVDDGRYPAIGSNTGSLLKTPGLKPKDIVGVPWRLAFALQSDGWWIRSDIVWAKSNPMPESVTDRPTKSHEYIFLLTKAAKYFYDAEAVREAQSEGTHDWIAKSVAPQSDKYAAVGGGHSGKMSAPNPAGRNLRSVWTMASEPFPGSHFAVFPTAIPERAIKAGTSEKGCCPTCGAQWVRIVDRWRVPHKQAPSPGGRQTVPGSATSATSCFSTGLVPATKTMGWSPSCSCPTHAPAPCTVLDPFFGAGTTGLVADRLQRHCIGIELNPEYVAMARRRIDDDRGALGCAIEQSIDTPLFAEEPRLL